MTSGFCNHYTGNDDILYSGGWRKANVAVNGTLEIQNSVISNGSAAGLFISSSSTINGMNSSDTDFETTLLSQNTISDNADVGILLQ